MSIVLIRFVMASVTLLFETGLVSVMAMCALSVLAFSCMVARLGRRLRRISWDYCPAAVATIRTANVHDLREECDFHGIR